MLAVEAQRRQHLLQRVGDDRGAPRLLLGLAFDPDAQHLRHLPHVQKPVDGVAHLGRGVGQHALRVDERGRLVLVAAAIALVAVGAVVVALRVGAGPPHQAVGQEATELGVVPLPAGALFQHAVSVQAGQEEVAQLLLDRKRLGL